MHNEIRELFFREALNVNFVNVLGGTSDLNPCRKPMPCSCTSRGRISIHNEEELARLFSNLKKLQIHGIIEDFSSRKNLHDFCYLNQHEELEFCLEYPLSFDRKILVPPLLLHPPCAFLKNLKNLAFTGQFSLPSKDLSIAVKLSKLKSLKLEFDAFIGE
ncbi:hypothetical protein FXO38_16707 [Capsicum annuum]|nr:hypothetical protein FXO38_16707 [Capsicum annuum]KAF3653414.1 hypothetical protein FXO37_16993 [Capsicum annuum]